MNRTVFKILAVHLILGCVGALSMTEVFTADIQNNQPFVLNRPSHLLVGSGSVKYEIMYDTMKEQTIIDHKDAILKDDMVAPLTLEDGTA